MATPDRGPSPGIASGIIMGGFLCLGLFLLAIAATVVLSLIGTYTSNNSQQGYGEQYRINALLLKILHANTTYTFNNGTVADSSTLSSFCSSVYLQSGASQFAGCVLSNFRAYGPYNNLTTSKRRRRATTTINGTALAGSATIYYSTTCATKKDRLKNSSGNALSSCVKTRLAQCNSALINGITSTLYPWTPLPNGLTLSAVESTLTTYVQLIITEVLAFPPGIANSTLRQFNVTSGQFLTDLIGGCEYIGPISQSNIAAAISAQATETTTAPSTINPSAG